MERNLEKRKFYVLKKSYSERNVYVSNIPSTLIKKYELLKGVSRGDDWPEKIIFQYSNDRKKGVLLTDYIDSSFSFLFVSNKFKELLMQWNLGDKEYLPVQIADHKRKLVSEDYWLVNFLQLTEAIDMKKSLYEADAGDPTQVFRFDKMILRDDVLPLLPSCFRLKEKPQMIILDEYLVRAIRDAGLSGMIFKAVETYRTYDTSDRDDSVKPVDSITIPKTSAKKLNLYESLKKAKPKQLVVAIENYKNEVIARFHKPHFCDQGSSDYLLDLKKPTYNNLKAIINQHKDEIFEGEIIECLTTQDFDTCITKCKDLMQLLGFSNFNSLAELNVEGYIQHLFWAGKDTHLGDIKKESDTVKKDGTIDWKAEAERIKEEFKEVILNYFEDHPNEDFESFAVEAIESVSVLVNDNGPDDEDYAFPTNVYTMDIEEFVQKNGTDEYHACLDAAVKLLRKDKELKQFLKKSTAIEINT